MEIGMLFLSLTLKNARKLGKLTKFFLVVRESRKNSAKMTNKCRQIFRYFPEKMWKFFGGPRTYTTFVKWSASRKRLRTAALTDHHDAFESFCAPVFCDFVRNYSCTVDGAVVTSYKRFVDTLS